MTTTEEKFRQIQSLRRNNKTVDAYNLALECFKADPYSTRLWHELGTCMLGVREYDRARQILSAVLEAEPQLPQVPYQLAWMDEAEGKYLDAAKWYARSVALFKAQPDRYEDECRAWFGLAQSLYRLGEREKGEHYLRQGLHWRCDTPQARYQRGMAQLSLGQHTPEAFADFEARWEIPHFRASQALHQTKLEELPPRWDGRAKGRVLVYAEQGTGDALMGLGYASAVWTVSGYPPIVQVPSHTVGLVYLLNGFPVADGERAPTCHFSIPSLSLPGVLGVRSLAVPRPTGRPQNTRPRVGVCWKGESSHLNDRDRSCPMDFREAFASEHYEIVSVQYGKGFHPKDYLETANVLQTLDYVVTVDTSVAHLAGLLGIPTFNFIPTAPEWRWPIKGEKAVWYPSMTLVRRHRWDEWEPAIERVKQRLHAKLGVSTKRAAPKAHGKDCPITHGNFLPCTCGQEAA